MSTRSVDLQKFAEDNGSHLNELYGQSCKHKKTRGIQYVKDTKASEIFKSRASTVAASGLLGAAGGAGVGFIGGCFFGPKGIVIGTVGGAVVGGAGGLLTGLIITAHSESKDYDRWLIHHRHVDTIPRFFSIFDTHPIRENEILRCSLTDALMRDPVKDIYGHSYEREKIETWISKYRISPINGKPLALTDLREDLGVKAIELNLYCQYLEREKVHLQLDEEQSHGLELFLEYLQCQVHNYVMKENKVALGEMERLRRERPLQANEWQAIYGRNLSAITTAINTPLPDSFSTEEEQTPAKDAYLQWRETHKHRSVPLLDKKFLKTPLFTENQDLQCPISQERMKHPRVDIYGHSYEKENIKTALNNNPSSPLCRKILTPRDHRKDYGLEALKYNLYRKKLEQIAPTLRLTTTQRTGLQLLIAYLIEKEGRLMAQEKKAAKRELARLNRLLPNQSATWQAIYNRRKHKLTTALAAPLPAERPRTPSTSNAETTSSEKQ